MEEVRWRRGGGGGLPECCQNLMCFMPTVRSLSMRNGLLFTTKILSLCPLQTRASLPPRYYIYTVVTASSVTTTATLCCYCYIYTLLSLLQLLLQHLHSAVTASSVTTISTFCCYYYIYTLHSLNYCPSLKVGVS